VTGLAPSPNFVGLSPQSPLCLRDIVSWPLRWTSPPPPSIRPCPKRYPFLLFWPIVFLVRCQNFFWPKHRFAFQDSLVFPFPLLWKKGRSPLLRTPWHPPPPTRDRCMRAPVSPRFSTSRRRPVEPTALRIRASSPLFPIFGGGWVANPLATSAIRCLFPRSSASFIVATLFPTNYPFAFQLFRLVVSRPHSRMSCLTVLPKRFLAVSCSVPVFFRNSDPVCFTRKFCLFAPRSPRVVRR